MLKVAAATATGASAAQVALAWARAHPARPLPILGARTLGQLQDYLAALKLHLDAEHLTDLEAVSRVELGFPQAMLTGDGIRQTVAGGQADLLDTRRLSFRPSGRRS